MAPLGAVEAFAKSGKLANRGDYISEDVNYSTSLKVLLLTYSTGVSHAPQDHER